MSREGVELASARESLVASQRHVRRLLHVLEAVAPGVDGGGPCYCSGYLASNNDHSDPCSAARRELLALRVERAGAFTVADAEEAGA